MRARCRIVSGLLAALLAAWVAGGEDPRPPFDALEITARPVKGTVELGDDVEIDLTFKNVGETSLAIHLWYAARCDVSFTDIAHTRGGGGGRTAPLDERDAPDHAWRRIEPGGVFRLRVVHERLGSDMLGKLKASVQYRGSPTKHGPADVYGGRRRSSRFTLTVVDNALLRAVKADPPQPGAARAEMLELLGRHRGFHDLFEEMHQNAGARLVPVLADIAADETVDEARRARAAGELGPAIYYAKEAERPRLRERALPVLRRLLSSQSARIREHAVRGLGIADRDRPHLERFDELCRDPAVEVRRAVADYLTWFLRHRETWPYVKRMLQDPDPKARRRMAQAHDLRQPWRPEHTELLLECCAVVDEEAALRLLGAMGSRASNAHVPTLAALFDRVPPRVQVALVRLAGRTTAARPVLEKALASRETTVRRAALAVLAHTAEPGLEDLLRRFGVARSSEEREQEALLLADLNAPVPFPDVRALIAQMLPPEPAEATTAELIEQAKQHDKEGADAANLLFLAEDPRDVALFRPLLDAERTEVRAAACRYLGRMRDGESYEKIVRLTRGFEPLVRREAVLALGRYARPEALPHLVRAARDPDHDASAAAPRAMGRIPGAATTQALVQLAGEQERRARWTTRFELDALVARGDRTAVPGLIELLDLPDGRAPSSDLRSALHKLAGHEIRGDYKDPQERTRLAGAWRAWWAEHGAKAPPPGPRGEVTRHGGRLTLDTPTQEARGRTIRVGFYLGGSGEPTPIVVPLRDEGVDCHLQYVLLRDGRELERGDLVPGVHWQCFGRYNWTPFGSLARLSGGRGGTFEFEPRAQPGDYELQVEARFLGIELASRSYSTNIMVPGPRVPAVEVFTLRSRRVLLTLRAPDPNAERLTDDAIERLARLIAEPKPGKQKIAVALVAGADGPQGKRKTREITIEGVYRAVFALSREGARALPAVLRHFEPESATRWQLNCLAGIGGPKAADAIERAFLSGGEDARQRVWPLRRSRHPKITARLVELATGEPGSKGWGWGESRAALEALDGRLGPQDKEHVPALCRELAGRLNSRRDRYVLRGGESVWGAFRTCFFLGRIGDRRAAGVLRRAERRGDPGSYLGRPQHVLLRWHAAAALKLIDVQNRPEPERRALAREWLRRCFASPDEHFMARGRLIPCLSELAGPDGRAFYRTLLPTLADPWMIHDAQRQAL